MPKSCHGFLSGIKEIFEKATAIERRGISVAFAIFTKFGDPIGRFPPIDNLKKPSQIEIRPPFIIKNPESICLDADHDILLMRREIRIACIFPSERDNHLSANCFRFTSTRPMPGCSYQWYSYRALPISKCGLLFLTHFDFLPPYVSTKRQTSRMRFPLAMTRDWPIKRGVTLAITRVCCDTLRV